MISAGFRLSVLEFMMGNLNAPQQEYFQKFSMGLHERIKYKAERDIGNQIFVQKVGFSIQAHVQPHSVPPINKQ